MNVPTPPARPAPRTESAAYQALQDGAADRAAPTLAYDALDDTLGRVIDLVLLGLALAGAACAVLAVAAAIDGLRPVALALLIAAIVGLVLRVLASGRGA